MPEFDHIFYEVALVLVIAAAIGGIATILRQPLIVSFIAVGIIAGPAGLGIVTEGATFELLAEMGIALLLFVVGLRLDLNLIRTSGPVALYTGLGQVLFTSTVGFLIGLMLGLSTLHALYVAVALTFSSTIIIVKLLSDKREIDSLHGRVAVGMLIVQDIVVVLVMIGLSAFGAGDEDTNLAREALLVLVQGAALLGGVALLMRYVIPRVIQLLARSQELLVLSAIGWAMVLATIGDVLGFSIEVGAFLAGVSLASTNFRESIGTRLVTMRDFLLLFFFLTLGASLDLSLLGAQVLPAVVLSLFVLIGNPLIVMAIMGVMGYRRRTNFLTGLTVAQISEFSLILAALGLSVGHINEETVGLITLVGLITIALSTYLILYSHQIYERLSPWLGIFERKRVHPQEEQDESDEPIDVIIYGLGRYGRNMALSMRDCGLTVMGIDFDPQVVQQWKDEGFHAEFGDAEDPEFPASLPLARTAWIVSTIPWLSTNLDLLRSIQQHPYDGRIALTAHFEHDAEVLRAAGADLVLMPFLDAANEAADMIVAQRQASGVGT